MPRIAPGPGRFAIDSNFDAGFLWRKVSVKRMMSASVQTPTPMNDTHDSTHDTAAAEQAPPRYASFSQAIDTARRDASSKAREAAPKLKETLAGVAHDLAYGAAFGACFAACFAKELVPAGVRESLRRGAKDGRKAAEAAAEAEMPPVPAPAA